MRPYEYISADPTLVVKRVGHPQQTPVSTLSRTADSTQHNTRQDNTTNMFTAASCTRTQARLPCVVACFTFRSTQGLSNAQHTATCRQRTSHRATVLFQQLTAPHFVVLHTCICARWEWSEVNVAGGQPPPEPPATTQHATHTTHHTQHTTPITQHTTHNAALMLAATFRSQYPPHVTHATHTTHTTHTTHDTRHTTHNTQHTTHDTQHTTHNTQHTNMQHTHTQDTQDTQHTHTHTHINTQMCEIWPLTRGCVIADTHTHTNRTHSRAYADMQTHPDIHTAVRDIWPLTRECVNATRNM